MSRFTIKNIPKYASAEFYIQNVLPRIKEKKLMSLKPFVDRLGYTRCCFLSIQALQLDATNTNPDQSALICIAEF